MKPTTRRRPSPWKIVGPILGVAVVAFVLFLVVLSVAGLRFPKLESERPWLPPSKSEIRDWAKEALLKSLLTPSTAKFPEEPDVTPLGDDWLVEGIVDSQNVFGAMLRKRWKATLIKQGDRKSNTYKVAVSFVD